MHWLDFHNQKTQTLLSIVDNTLFFQDKYQHQITFSNDSLRVEYPPPYKHNVRN